MIAYILTAIIACKVSRLVWAWLGAVIVSLFVAGLWLFLKPYVPIMSGLVISFPLHLIVATSAFYITRWRKRKRQAALPPDGG